MRGSSFGARGPKFPQVSGFGVKLPQVAARRAFRAVRTRAQRTARHGTARHDL
jgi:hypothetical protein